MTAVVAILLVKALDPILIVIALLSGVYCKKWLWVPLLAVAPALLVEIILTMNQATSRQHLPLFLLGYLASLTWVAISFKAMSWWRSKRSAAAIDSE